MNLYSSELACPGALSNEASRAARLVLDPGMHPMGWTGEVALDDMPAYAAKGSVPLPMLGASIEAWIADVQNENGY